MSESSTAREVSHYVVTAHPPGAVLCATKCNFISPNSTDVVMAKASRLHVRSLQSETAEFTLTLQVPIYGRIVVLESIRIPGLETSGIFVLTHDLQYAVMSYEASHSPYCIFTHTTGSLKNSEGDNDRRNQNGVLCCIDELHRCVAIHGFDGLISVLPIDNNYTPVSFKDDGTSRPKRSMLKHPFHCRIEEFLLLDMCFLTGSSEGEAPSLCLLHQDARGSQHVVSHRIHLDNQTLQLHAGNLRKSNVDGGSSIVLAVRNWVAAAGSGAAPPHPGVLVLGQKQIAYCSAVSTKIIPVNQRLFQAVSDVPPDGNGATRFLLGDEYGYLHMLMLTSVNGTVSDMRLETLGNANIASTLQYLGDGLLFVGSSLCDSQLLQIHNQPVPVEDAGGENDNNNNNNNMLVDTSYLAVLDEYTNLGPITDFDLVPTAPGTMQQHQVVASSGFSKSGSIRVIRNGIGMNEYANVEIPGIQNMWSLRKSFADAHDSFLVQSFVGETRVLGVTEAMDDEDGEVAGSLEEVEIAGLANTESTLFICNIEANDRLLQVTEQEIRLLSAGSDKVLSTWSGQSPITVASANGAGQIAVSLQGGMLVYLKIVNDKISKVQEQQMDREVGCVNISPFDAASDSMEIEESKAPKSSLIAVGLWDDFTVRLLAIDRDLEEVECISLSSDDDESNEKGVSSPSRRTRNMMARSLCLVTLDFSNSSSNSSSSPGVNMLFVGLGDGTVISFAVVSSKGVVSVQSRKEVCLGTQRIGLVPLHTKQGGTCVVATGDRPTVIYLAGVGGTTASQFNPKLCYSNVSFAASDDEDEDEYSRNPSQQSVAVNVAAPFYSPLLFDTSSLGTRHYSLCVADSSSLRLGVIDDIQKLHVTTFRLGMTPRRIVSFPEGRMLAVGCVESGNQSFALDCDEGNMGNCVRFIDDTSFELIDRIDLEPYEMILSMACVSMKVPKSLSDDTDKEKPPTFKSYLLIGTAYALPDEDDATRGRIMVYTCSDEGDGNTNMENARALVRVAELTTEGSVYSICQFYGGRVLVCVNTRTHVAELVDDNGLTKLSYRGTGHFGHIMSLFVKSRAQVSKVRHSTSGSDNAALGASQEYDSSEKSPAEMLAVVGDMMRSVSLMQYYPEHSSLEEVARDFNTNWTTALEMLNDNIYLGAEMWHNLFCLRRNAAASSEEIRSRLDTVGEFHLGEQCQKFMSGSLVMPVSSNSTSSSRRSVRRTTSPKKKSDKTDSPGKNSATSSRVRRAVVTTGSQTIFGTTDGTLGAILGLDQSTHAFFVTLERSMAKVIPPVGGFTHQLYRNFTGDGRLHPAHGFIDGDLVESFLDLDRTTMDSVVAEMNKDGGWDVDESSLKIDELKSGEDEVFEDTEEALLTVEDVLAMVEEMAMLH